MHRYRPTAWRPAPAHPLTTSASRGGGVMEEIPSTVHKTAEQGPQPETLFRPDAGRLQASRLLASAGTWRPVLHPSLSPDSTTLPSTSTLQGGGEGEEEQGEHGGGELPFPSIPQLQPDYESERPQEQTALEPPNPMPQLPPNHPPGEVRLGVVSAPAWHENTSVVQPEGGPAALPAQQKGCGSPACPLSCAGAQGPGA